MITPLWPALVFLSYLLGSVPFGLVVGKLAKGLDVRQYGSGNIGTANVLRTMGRKWSVVVFLCDFGKAAVAVLLARWLVGVPALEAACAGAAVVGHTWSPYLGLKGGKGVASGFGGFVALSPLAAVIVAVFGLAVMAISRYVSLGSILSSVFAIFVIAGLAWWGGQPVEYVVYAVLMAALIVFRHSENIARLRAGTESRIGQKAEKRVEVVD